ncbi:HAMP domain-containing histidine kinase [Bacillus sp. H-16]|uniref:sensor histidine kinase n=1 Tax=Alteribacter salitolerans TaxID=2912333 RepID=UPI001962C2E7|nr:HAMP domain-containing sensor histidine kinase [Alteribacter salitolerans]MBM7096788.1 HAMP domain-containing histidine kinase [Alteribacter salitolerans]
MTETLLINVLFLLTPLIMYLIFLEDTYPISSKKLMILLSAFSMVLCMSFPITLEIGFIFDLRYIPFIIASLYGGVKVALPLYVILNIYRFFIGGEGVIQSFLFSTVILLIVIYLGRKFLTHPPRQRITIATSLSFFMVSFFLATLMPFYGATATFAVISANVLSIHILGTLVLMLLVEKIITNAKARESLIQSERLNTISELSASVSHEIRNPLTVSSGFLQLLNQSKTIQPSDKRYVDLSLLEIKRAEKIVTDFLSLAKPQAENMVRSNLEEEFVYVNSIMSPFAKMHQVELNYTFDNSIALTYDKNQMQQCLINLYKNGIEAMKENPGTLIVEAAGQCDTITIRIQDEGTGMTKEETARMGKPYYSTKDKGTGLGMVVVYSTIYKLKGKIHVESEKDRGTTFHITIPGTE